MAGLALILRLRISEPRTPANGRDRSRRVARSRDQITPHRTRPVVDCPAGERKHELAEEHLAKTNITRGSNAGKDATPPKEEL